jgi:ABC-type antimicrobial peptide transport system permease subunit
MRIDNGIDYGGVLTVPLFPLTTSSTVTDLSRQDKQTAGTHPSISEAMTTIRSLPGVDLVAGLSGGLPFSHFSGRTGVRVDGSDFSESVEIRGASPGYLRAVGLTLLKGRWIDDADVSGSLPVIILNDVSERSYFPGHSGLGRTIDIRGPKTVVGVVAAVRLGGPESDMRPEAYVPLNQIHATGIDLVLRSRVRLSSLIPKVKAAILSVAPPGAWATAPEPVALGTWHARLIAPRRFNMIVTGFFGLVALIITNIGVYGFVSSVTRSRVREYGVRLALGASPSSVLVLALRSVMVPVLLGLGIGGCGAVALSRGIDAFLFRVTVLDPSVYSVVTLALVGVCLLAALSPALRASRIDPLTTMKTE